MINLTEADRKLFASLVKWAPDWNGQPLLDISKEERGNLTHLKKAGLLTTFKEDDGCVFAMFTPEGQSLAIQEFGAEKNW